MKIKDVTNALSRLSRQRDIITLGNDTVQALEAAVAILSEHGDLCTVCKYDDAHDVLCYGEPCDDNDAETCAVCNGFDNWQWRGV